MKFNPQTLGKTFVVLLFIFSTVTVFAQADTVDWSNVNLNYKPPMPGETHGEFVPQPQLDGGAGGQITLNPQTVHPTPPRDTSSFGTPQGIGESFGFSGPIIVCGKIKKDCAIAIFDSTGACVGTVTSKQATDNPERMGNLLSIAEALSREDFNRILIQGLNKGRKKVLSGAFTTTEPPALQVAAPSGDLNQILTDLDTQTELRDNLQSQIADMEKGLSKMPDGGDDLAQAVRSDLVTNLGNAHAELERVNQEVSRLNGERSAFATGPGDMSILTSRERAEMTGSLDTLGSPPPDTPQGAGPGLWNTIAPRIGFSYDIRGDGSTRLRSQLQQRGLEVNHIGSFQPSTVMLPQLGQPQNGLNQLAGDLNQSLTARRNACNEKCFIIFIGRPRIYIIETIWGRMVLEEDPNDPLYGYKKKKKKKGGLLKAVSFGIFGGGGSGGGFGGAGVNIGRPASKKGPDIKNQWGLHTIGYLPKSENDSAWNVIDGHEKNVLVAVIDSGLYMEHPDGPQFIWSNPNEIPDNGIDDDANGYIDDIHGWNFYDNNNDLTDLRGHGTFVSGIIAAQRNNGIGIAGINPGAEIMMLKVTDEHGNTNSLNIYRAIRYAVDQGARILNVSLGGKGISQLEQLAINYAYANGALVIVASGNIGENIMEHGPAAAQRTFVVGSLDYSEDRSTISHVGANNGLLAPGEDIYSIHSKDAPWEGGSADRNRLYYKASGTSFSVPMVTATASLMLAKDPELTNRQIMDILLASATDLEEEGWDGRTGAGILDAAKALRTNPDDILAAQITSIKLNRDKKKLKSVDVYATVHGKDLKEFVVELGRGKNPGKFKTIAGPFTQEANNSWVKRFDERELRGSKDWVVRIKALNNQGKAQTAQAYFSTK